MKNIIIAHGGAPTAVINASLAGAIECARTLGFDGKILAPKFGSKGILNEQFIDLTDISDFQLQLLKHTPGSAIGTSRHPLEEADYRRIVEILDKNNVGYVLFTGGNGSMDTLGNIYKYSDGRFLCGGIPKTIDNDIAVTDHAPGFASCARYMAQTVRDCAQDVMGLPIHVSVIEAMGRNAGWLTASACLARQNRDDAPHLLYMPEVAFDEDKFLDEVLQMHRKYGGVIVVASEGLKYKDGTPIVKPTLTVGRAVYYGDVSVHLANLILSRLNIKSRSEKPGLICRCSSALVSETDRNEAVLMGATAMQAVLQNKTGVMAGIERISSQPYSIRPILIPIEQVMMTESMMPKHFINDSGNGVTDAFVKWLTPLVGELSTPITFLK